MRSKIETLGRIGGRKEEEFFLGKFEFLFSKTVNERRRDVLQHYLAKMVFYFRAYPFFFLILLCMYFPFWRFLNIFFLSLVLFPLSSPVSLAGPSGGLKDGLKGGVRSLKGQRRTRLPLARREESFKFSIRIAFNETIVIPKVAQVSLPPSPTSSSQSFGHLSLCLLSFHLSFSRST